VVSRIDGARHNYARKCGEMTASEGKSLKGKVGDNRVRIKIS
jgi:hypothetical protein